MYYQMAYYSVSQRPVTDAVVRNLLMASRFNNRRDGITGMLMADGQRFIQMLEGSEDAVRVLYDRIEQDSRHHCVVELMRQSQVAQRWCPNWSMGYIALSSQEFTDVVMQLIASLDVSACATWARSAVILKAFVGTEVADAPCAMRA
jgi:Sensors of blue-light using FAD